MVGSPFNKMEIPYGTRVVKTSAVAFYHRTCRYLCSIIFLPRKKTKKIGGKNEALSSKKCF